MTVMITETYWKKHHKGSTPLLRCKINKKLTGYSASAEGNRISLEVANSDIGEFAVHRIITGLRSHHTAEFLGRHTPKYHQRPLWIKEVPKIPPQLIAERLKQMGFNALIFKEEPPEEIVSELNTYGIQIGYEIYNLDTKPVACNFIFYTSQVITEPHPRYTSILKELQKAEEFSLPLIFFLPTPNKFLSEQHAFWFEELCDEVALKTTLAFDGSANTKDLWELLRCSEDCSATPLLPILDLSSSLMGEGLWPILPITSFNYCLSRMRRHNFSGCIIRSATLPQVGSLLDCNLWVAGQMQWGSLTPELLTETWMKSNQEKMLPLLRNGVFSTLFENITKINELHNSDIKGDESFSEKDCLRFEAQTILNSLNQMRLLYEKPEPEKGKESDNLEFSDYIRFFIRDAKRLLFSALQKKKLSIPSLLEGNDIKEAFWTRLSQQPTNGIGAGVDVITLDQPHVEEGVMLQIYNQTRM